MTQNTVPTPAMPGSRYAAELAKSGQDMRFPPNLERDYHLFYLAERRSHVRFFNAVMGAIAVIALIVAAQLDHENAGPGQFLRISTIAALYFALAWLARSRYFERWYLKAAHRASLLIALLLAVEVATWIEAQVGEAFGLLTLHSLGLYFLAGILFRAALQANAVMIATLSVALAWLRIAPLEVALLTGSLAGAAAIGGLAFRHQGIRFRRTFLEHRLIVEMAERDGLTGLKNRRAFDEHLLCSWRQAMRYRRRLALLMIDVDYFKPYNDHYGHQAGDATLQQVAGIVDGFAQRALDIAARFGGEEMAVILYDVSRSQAEAIGEKLRSAIEALGIEHARSDAAGVVSVSVGVAVVRPAMDRSPEGIVQLADEALYAAKQGGRNRVEVYQTEYDDMSTGVFRHR